MTERSKALWVSAGFAFSGVICLASLLSGSSLWALFAGINAFGASLAWMLLANKSA